MDKHAIVMAYLEMERNDHPSQSIREYLLRLIPTLKDITEDIVPYCLRHGVVGHSHRCNSFDDMPNQVIDRADLTGIR